LRELENFIPVYLYQDLDLTAESPWEYGCLRFSNIYMRIYPTSIHPKFLEVLENCIRPKKN